MYLCIFMTTLMIPFIVLNQFWMIWHQSRYTGRVLATKMCFVLESSSQGANDVKENRPLLVCILTHLIKCLGWCSPTTQDKLGQPAADSSCSHLADFTWRAVDREGSGDVKNTAFSEGIVCFPCFTDDKTAARIAHKVRNLKKKKKMARGIHVRSLFCSFFL